MCQCSIENINTHAWGTRRRSIVEDATGAEEVVEIADGHLSDIEIVEIVILKIIVNENLDL